MVHGGLHCRGNWHSLLLWRIQQPFLPGNPREGDMAAQLVFTKKWPMSRCFGKGVTSSLNPIVSQSQSHISDTRSMAYTGPTYISDTRAITIVSQCALWALQPSLTAHVWNPGISSATVESKALPWHWSCYNFEHTCAPIAGFPGCFTSILTSHSITNTAVWVLAL